MKIINEYPPNIEELRKHFQITINTVFTYGDILYVPSGNEIPPDLMVHEETHTKQQFSIGVDVWWAKYIADADFRMKQEVEAYQNQYKYAVKNYSREHHRKLLSIISRDLSSGLYGLKINKKEAENLIKSVL